MATPEASGTFRQYPLPRLLFYLYRKQFTGTMIVQGGGIVYLRDGILVCGDRPEPDAGQTIEEAAQAHKQALLEQVTQLFALENAEFAIHRGGHDFGATPEEARQLRLHPRRVIYQGIRASYDIPRIWRELGGALDGHAVRIGGEATTSLSRYRFSTDDQTLVNKLTEGYWSPTNLVAATGAHDVDAWRLLYALWVTGMLDLRPHDEESSVSLPPRQMAQPAEPVENRPGTYRFSKEALSPEAREERIELPATVPQVTQLPSEVEVVRARIESTARGLFQMSEYDLLGVTKDATREQIKSAYVMQKRAYDPDRLALLKLESFREAAERICGAIEAAYARLIRPFHDAERSVEEGLEALKQKRFPLAEQHFRHALELRPDDAGAQEGLRLALARSRPKAGR